MENIGEKATFLRNDFVKILSTIAPDTQPLWGKMNLQQMVEHMSYALRQASGKDPYTLLTPDEHLPKMQAFLMSEKEFKENTPNQLLPEEPLPLQHDTLQAALTDLQAEIENFFHVFAQEPGKEVINPFFGTLNYDMQVQLLHKHAWHHLKQFGISR